MKRKKQFNHFKSLLEDNPILLTVMVIVGIILWGGDFSLSSPVYQLIFDVPWQANLLACLIATLFSALPKLTGWLFAKRRYWVACIGILGSSFLFAILFFGQQEVVLQKSNDPLAFILTGSPPENVDSSIQHYIATGLLVALYIFSVFISYIYFSAKVAFLPTAKGIIQKSLLRSLQSEITLTNGRLERLKAQPRLLAESKVHENIQAKEQQLFELQRELERQKILKEIDLAFLNNAKSRALLAIHIAFLSKH
jgi:hypothetical protein